MDQPTHVLDADGEVIIVLGDPDSSFAAWNEEMVAYELQEAETARDSSPDVMVISKRKYNLNRKKNGRKTRIPRRTGGEVEKEPIEVPEAPVEEPATGPADRDHGGMEQHDGDEPLSERVYRIQVSAKHLTLASPVFRNTLRGGRKESVTLFQTGSVEIHTTGWDIEAFVILLQLIHCQANDIVKEVSFELLAKITVIADYYECKEVVRLFLEVWIPNLPNIPTTYCRDLMLWLWISWVFRLSIQFHKATSIAMSQSPGRISSLALPIPQNVLGEQRRVPVSADLTYIYLMLEAMNNAREEGIANLLHILHEEQTAFLYDQKGCSFACRSMMYGALTKAMQCNGLNLPRPEPPFHGLNYGGLVQKMISFESPPWYKSRGSSCDHRDVCVYSTFASLFDLLYRNIEGLDLSHYIS
ncbi:hypothetical protein FE257_006928 [Aspergillus nanangensis]|uniref:BTB domain-containing protein n=1 Tax=Aspergillus nanangensis TaxID=2582783 RepID=A0AAD4CP58_ASPNN|nr:hypothetical protein FE257_006928 [Aspergillus nanangensis]